MSLEDIRSECSDIAGLLQPYVDGELQVDEQEKVGEHLHRCSGCRAAVSEQAWVRATLQSVHRERAPQAVRARILQGLDEIDHEAARASAASSAQVGLGSRVWNRLRDLGRGGLIMVPAGAVAVGLFFVAREGIAPTDDAPKEAGMAVGIGSALMPGAESRRQVAEVADAGAQGVSQEGIDEELLRHVRSLEPSVGFGVQLPSNATRPRTGSAQIQLVGASVDHDDPAADPSVRLRYEVRRQDRSAVGVFFDRQLRAASFDAPGQPVSVGGRQYRLHRTVGGEPVVYFELGAIVHAVTFEGRPGTAPDMGVGPALPVGTEPDYGPVLRLAEHLRAVSASPR